VSDSFPDVPDDLDRLCRELLARDPKTRPRGRMILKKIKGEDDSTGVRRILPRPVRAGVFVGRDGPLAILASATEAARRGRTVTVFVEGRSGMGKSALVTKFLERLSSRDHDAIVLAGRCYQQESVPYKAVDSVLDSLCEWLLARKPEEVAPLLPRHTLALARLFPVLLQVPAVHEAARELLGMPEAQELRRRAFAALKELLFNLSRRGLVVLAIDDLQWGDVDSALLLGEILTPPAPPLLLVAAYRSEERESSPVLAALRTTLSSPGDIHRILLEELPLAEAEEMAESLALSRQRTVSRDWLEAVAQESGGNPSFIEELVRHSRAGDVGSRGGLSLDTVIASRTTRLPVDVRRFLETVAVAGQPIRTDVAKEAARLEADERKVVALLRSEHLVGPHAKGPRGDRVHSRIRDLLPRASRPTRSRTSTGAFGRWPRARTRRRTLRTTSRRRRRDARARHTEEAPRGLPKLSFDRSVRFTGALTLAGEAIAAAGRGALERLPGRDAAGPSARRPRAPEDVALELSRRAAEQLLRSGYVDEGLEGLSKVLKVVGMELAKTPGQALRSFLLTRARLKLRGLSWKERKASDLPARTLARIDTCWAVALGLSMVDTIRGADFQARHLLLALEAGEPYRVARALGLEVGYIATSGVSAHEEVTERLEAARRAAEISNEPHAKGFVMLIAGIAAALEGRFDEATFLATEAEDILRTECSGVSWELFNAQYFSLLSLYYLGHFRSLSGRLPQLLKEAEERGDLCAVTSLTTRVAYLARLAFDDPVGAREDVARAMARWSTSGFHVQHVWRLFAEIEIDLYLGAAREATERIEKIWGDLEKSLLLRIQLVRIGAVHRRARAALAASRTYPLRATERVRKLALATSLAKKIELEKALWADPLAALLRAGIAETEGDHEAAKTHLSHAELGFGVSRMAAYATAARARRAALVGGDEGREIAEGRALADGRGNPPSGTVRRDARAGLWRLSL
jgi:hypothetical protein